MSPFSRSSRSAVPGAISAALSQVILVTGLGSSWSQPLLAKRPSYTVESRRKFTSNAGAIIGAVGAGGGATGVEGGAAAEGAAGTGDAVDDAASAAPVVNAVPGMKPSWSHLRQVFSNCAAASCAASIGGAACACATRAATFCSAGCVPVVVLPA